MISAPGSNPSVLDGLAALTRVGVARTSRLQRDEGASTAPVGRTTRETDRVELSPAARAASTPTVTTIAGGDCDCDEGPDGLTDEERAQVRELEQRDRAVRSHEQAHKAAGGAHAGGITYSYQTGPNGQRYAVGGQVPIDVSPVEGDHEATIQKMQQVRRAALAPSDPSSADRSVAAKAQQIERQARAEQQREAAAGDEDHGPGEDHAGEHEPIDLLA